MFVISGGWDLCLSVLVQKYAGFKHLGVTITRVTLSVVSHLRIFLLAIEALNQSEFLPPAN